MLPLSYLLPEILRQGYILHCGGSREKRGYLVGGETGYATADAGAEELLAGMLLVDWKLGLLVYGIAILVYALYYRNAMKYFGGTTGDLAGCFLSLCEVFMACGAVLGALWL